MEKNGQRENKNNHSGCVAGIYSSRIRDDDTRCPECVFQIRCRPSLLLVVFSLLFFLFFSFDSRGIRILRDEHENENTADTKGRKKT